MQRFLQLMLCAGVMLSAGWPLGAQPFRNADLFFGRAIVPSPKVRKLRFGLDFEIAPVRAILQSQIDKVVNSYPGGQQVVTLLQSSDVSKLKAMSIDQIKAELSKIPGLTPQEQQLIGGLTESDRKLVVEVADLVANKDQGITFSLEPYAEYSFGWLALNLKVPVAGFHLNGTDFVMGNINLDVKGSVIFGKSIAVGILYGTHFYFPSGTKKANALGLQNAFKVPMYFHQYLTISPYVGFGVDFKFVVVQAHLEFPQMTKVRGEARHKYSTYLRYGAGVAIVPLSLLNITVAMDGIKGLKNGSEFNTHTISAGVRFLFFGVNIGAAVQVPILQDKNSAFASYGGLNFGSPSKYNFSLNLSYQH